MSKTKTLVMKSFLVGVIITLIVEYGVVIFLGYNALK